MMNKSDFLDLIKDNNQIGGVMDRILVIDDEEGIVNLLSKVLTYLGYEVRVAHDGREGIDLFNRDCNFDLVITGICMPRMDGNEVAEYIRESDRAETPVVAMTGSGEEAINRGLFDLSLIKPFRLKSLIEGIKSFKQDY